MTPTTTRLPTQGSTFLKLSAAGLLVAVAGLCASQAQAQPATPQHAAHHRMAPAMGMHGLAIPERLLDEVGASAEQKRQLREIFQAAGDDLRSQREAGRALHGQMLALMAAPQVDAAAAEALRQQQLARHDAASKRSLQAMLDAQAVLTPEQRARIAERMAMRQKMMDRRHQHGGPAAPKG